MRTPTLLLTTFLALASTASLAAPSARAAEPQANRTCLTPTATQEAVYAGQARRLSEVRDGIEGELIRADLCRDGSGYVYIVTTLGKNGKVKRQVLDATPSTSGYGAPVRSGY
jgi:hypothetical protein